MSEYISGLLQTATVKIYGNAKCNLNTELDAELNDMTGLKSERS